MPSIKCPFCKSNFDAFDIMEGRVQCPNCGKYVEVGEVEENPLKKYRDPQPGAEAALAPAGAPEAAAAPPPDAPPAETPSSAPADGTGTGGTGTPEGSKDKYVKIKTGQVLGGFRIDEILGAGAMAVVYKATQLSLNRPVALKILPERFARNRTFIERFDKESDALAALNHPNIIGVVDRGNDGTTYFFAMEYVEGTSLREMMMSDQVGEEFFIRIIKQCCEGLKYAHSKDIIHRDIKPSNIMLNSQGIAKLADFGLAGILAEERQVKSRKRMVMGTRGYMPPEQSIDISQTDARSDIYSLGAVMYEVLVGHLPETSPPPPPSKLKKNLDPRIDAIILKCLKLDPQERYQSIQELIEEIDKYHAILTAVGEVCPNCGAQNPVREKKCLKCGQDLSELFDLCPECRHENRHDVQVCFNCGSNLQELRERISIQIGKLQMQARELMKARQFDDALRRLQAIMNVEGKRFEYPRKKAAEMVQECKTARSDYYKHQRDKAQKLALAGDPLKAIEKLKAIPREEMDVSQEIDNLNNLVAACKDKVKAAGAAIKKYDAEGAKKLLSDVAKAWKGCPGYADAKGAFDSLAQTESMIDFQLAEADRLLEEKNFIDARESLRFALDSTPEHPRVKAKLAEIDRREATIAVDGYLLEGKTCYEQKRYEETAFHWKSAADLLPDADNRKAALLKKIDQAKELAQGPDAVKLTAPKPQKATKQESGVAQKPDLQVRQASSRKWVAPVVVVGVLAVLAAAAYFLYNMGKGTPESGTLIAVNPGDGKGKTPTPSQENSTSPDNTNPPPKVSPSGPFDANFDAGEAPDWQVVSGNWRVVSTGRRSYRCLSPDIWSVTEHKYFNCQDVGVRATFTIDALKGSTPPLVAFQVRRTGPRALELRLEKKEADKLTARLVAVDNNKVIQESEPLEMPFGLNRPYEATIDAIGPRAVATLDKKQLFLYGLPAQFTTAGKAALVSYNCSTSWDEIHLGIADPDRVPEKAPEPAAPEKPKEPEAVPLAQLPAQKGPSVNLGTPACIVHSSFKTADYWKNLTGTPVIANSRLQSRGQQKMLTVMNTFVEPDADIQGQCRIERFGNDSKGTSVGLAARCKDANNFLVMGIRGLGKDTGTPFIAARVNGKETLRIVEKPNIFIPTAQDIRMRLIVKGNTAVGMIDNKRMVSLDNLDKLGLRAGPVGMFSEGMQVVWANCTVSLPALPAVEVPADVEAKITPNEIKIVKARLSPITIKGLKAKDGRLAVTFVISGKESGYPQIALHGRLNDERENYFMTIDLPSRKGSKCRVALHGRLVIGGRLRTGLYAKEAGPELWQGDTVTVELRITGRNIAGYINGRPVISARDSSKTPVREYVGEWGFRTSYLQSTVTKIEWWD